jgi:hypothetical protein
MRRDKRSLSAAEAARANSASAFRATVDRASASAPTTRPVRISING